MKKKKGPGYHLRVIEKGVIGEASKIAEEIEELKDSESQDARIMALVELSDMYGAIQRYIEKKHPSVTMDELRAKCREPAIYNRVRSDSQTVEGSLIQYEFEKFKQAENASQEAVVENLACVLQAMSLYLENNFPGLYFKGLNIGDLAKMSQITRRAFENGHR